MVRYTHHRELVESIEWAVFDFVSMGVRNTLFACLVLSSKTSSVSAAAESASAAAWPPSAKTSSFGSFTLGLGFVDGNGSFSDLLAVH